MEINTNALKYALIRAFIPSLTIIFIILICTLDLKESYVVLTQKTYLGGIIRILITAAEICWIWWNYEQFIKYKK